MSLSIVHRAVVLYTSQMVSEVQLTTYIDKLQVQSFNTYQR